METDEIKYDVVNGEIVDGKTRATEVNVWTVEDHPVNITFEEPVPEDDIPEKATRRFIEKINELQEDTDFSYRESQRFSEGSTVAEALVTMFHIDPCTTSQFSGTWEGDYASSYPSKLRGKGLVQSIGEVGNKSIWTLTPEGVKEALCLMGHPTAEEELKGIRRPENRSGLEELFPDSNGNNGE